MEAKVILDGIVQSNSEAPTLAKIARRYRRRIDKNDMGEDNRRYEFVWSEIFNRFEMMGTSNPIFNNFWTMPTSDELIGMSNANTLTTDLYKLQARFHNFEIPCEIEESTDVEEITTWMSIIVQEIVDRQRQCALPDWLLDALERWKQVYLSP